MTTWLIAFIIVVLAVLALKFLSLSGAFHKIEVKTGEPPFQNLHIGIFNIILTD